MLDLFDALDVLHQIDPEVKPMDNGSLEPLAIEASQQGQARYRLALEARARRDDPTREATSLPEARRAMMAGTDKHCGAGSNTIAVDPYGRVLPCVQWRVPIGNVHQQRLTEIWAFSDGLREVRETTKAARRMLDGHGDDEAVASFCPGAAHTYSGDALRLYPSAKRRTEELGRARVRLAVL